MGTYAYSTTHPGAVTGVSGGPAGVGSYSYNANGNMIGRRGKDISWHPFPLPKRIEYGESDFAEFSYGPDRQRLQQIAKTGATTVTTHYIGPHFQVEINGTQRRYRSTAFANGTAIYSQVEQNSPATFDAYFLHRDHQGSVDTLSRVVGAGTQTLAQRFDAFGKRRNENWTADSDDNRARDPHFLAEGYTGHEHLDNLRLIHMNGRLQDPLLGTLLSPDPLFANLLNPQSLNRYGYVVNNPASLVDPSGFLFGHIGKFFKRLVSGAGSLVRRVLDKYGREVLAAVAAYYTAGATSAWYAVSAEGATALGAGTVGAIAGELPPAGSSRGISGELPLGRWAGLDSGPWARLTGTPGPWAASGPPGWRGCHCNPRRGDFQQGFALAGGGGFWLCL